ncbi:MAG: nucleotidyltransferase domain-containing protein [Phycisphaera sp.]|nr:MAG: nucleotidyltransferase domain-containing protein [Phycisphaera sp.]
MPTSEPHRIVPDHPLRQDLIDPYLEAHPHRVLFVTVSGAHLYGFASPDSDYDLRGAHVIDLPSMIGLDRPRETYEILDRDAEVEMDLVTHDARKFFTMLLGRNGYVLEQICSPLVVHAGEGFAELRDIAMRCLTRHHRHHFRSFATNQWDRVAGPSRGTVKGLLYSYRPLMAGIYLLEEKAMESNLRTLNEKFGLPFIDDLIERKVSGAETQLLGQADLGFHREQFEQLNERLESAAEKCGLPETPPEAARQELNGLLVRLRLETHRA